MIKETNVYKRMGFDNRKEYLLQLSNEYDMPSRDIFKMANLLGSSEDFDGLIVALEDFDCTIEAWL